MSNKAYQRRSPISQRVDVYPNRNTNQSMAKNEFQPLRIHAMKKFDTTKTDSDDDEWESDDDEAKQLTDTESSGSNCIHIYALVVVALTLTVLFLFHSNSADKQSSSAQEHVLPGGYKSVEELMSRSLRFPSVKDRIKLYMSSWYSLPCDYIDGKLHESDSSTLPINSTLPQFNFIFDSPDQLPVLLLQELKIQTHEHDLFGRLFLVDSGAETKGSVIFYMDPKQMQKCNNSFCQDTKTYLLPALKRIQEASKTIWDVPLLFEFGDAEISRAYRPATNKNETYPTVPIIKKFRYSMNRDELRRVTSRTCYDATGKASHDIPMARNGEDRIQPIVSKLTYKRHFGMLDEIVEFDIAWSQKRDGAIWRGALTGQKRDGYTARDTGSMTAKETCLLMHRCRLVYHCAQSDIVDAKLVSLPGRKEVLPESIEGFKIFGEKASYADMLEYKAIIMLEGNDVSSGLKWALYSNSVLMTQASTYTSWAMEELLEPWVHYVPLNEDLSDVEEKMQWVLDNDDSAQEIAHRGKLWISDMIFHPNAQHDDDLIFEETFKRYRYHFSLNKQLTI